MSVRVGSGAPIGECVVGAETGATGCEEPLDIGLGEMDGGGNLSNEEEEVREDVGDSAEGEANPFALLPSALSMIAIVFFFFFLIGVIMGIICGDPGTISGGAKPFPAGFTGKEAVARAKSHGQEAMQ